MVFPSLDMTSASTGASEDSACVGPRGGTWRRVPEEGMRLVVWRLGVTAAMAGEEEEVRATGLGVRVLPIPDRTTEALLGPSWIMG